MTRTIARLAATACGICLLGALPAAAADIRGQLTPDLIYDHCRAAGVGSEAEGTFMLPDGRRINGTVLCTAEDLVAAKAKPSRHREDDEEEDDDPLEGYDA
ncbi:hypothetical protein [Devosia sp. A16]|uniref:hypothetical protein n=1 Tax=Devosia sp. A16 TaxID=1736675 RepID=UPI0006D7A2ED|nr:hypothetical protein [Devosia sp. A16]